MNSFKISAKVFFLVLTLAVVSRPVVVTANRAADVLPAAPTLKTDFFAAGALILGGGQARYCFTHRSPEIPNLKLLPAENTGVPALAPPCIGEEIPRDGLSAPAAVRSFQSFSPPNFQVLRI